MGKVKQSTDMNYNYECKVSIPNGKGKEKVLPQMEELEDVSIPNGKGKEQHFAL